jgi:tetratricopeptide (TPR) repeat protein
MNLQYKDRGRWDMKNADSMRKEERRKYLGKLFSRTEKEVDNKIRRSEYDGAIALLNSKIARLEKKDYEDLPSKVGTFYGFLHVVHFKAAFAHMKAALEAQEKCVELRTKSGDLALQALSMSSLASLHQFLGDMNRAEEIFRTAIAVAEAAPIEGGENPDYGRYYAVFDTKTELMRFYIWNGRIDEARIMAKELNLMIESGQVSGPSRTKQDVESWFSPKI